MTPEDIFAQLGFNTLESEVYVALLRHGPQTAYKIGKLINKPTANVYKAVEVLALEGAIEIMETEVRICKAIPIETVVKQLETAYKRKADKALAALTPIKEEKGEEGIFKLQTIESVLQRAKEMIHRAESIIVVDAFPATLTKISEDLNEMAKAKVDIFVQAYEPIKLHKKIAVVVPDLSYQALQYWEAQQINIAVDGKEILVALFNKDLTKLIQATYSNNLYLSCIMHSGLISEHKVHRYAQAKSTKEINEITGTQKNFLNTNVPGLNILFEQYKSNSLDQSAD